MLHGVGCGLHLQQGAETRELRVLLGAESSMLSKLEGLAEKFHNLQVGRIKSESERWCVVCMPPRGNRGSVLLTDCF